MLQKSLEIKIYQKKTEIKSKKHNNTQNLNIHIRNLDTNKGQKAKKHF